MSSDKEGMVPAQQIHKGLNSQPQLVFPASLACGPQPPHRPPPTGDPGPKNATRLLTTGFLDHCHFFVPQLQHQAAQFHNQWNANSCNSGCGAASEDDSDDDVENEGMEEEVNNMGNMVTLAKSIDDNQNVRYGGNSKSQRMKHISAFGIKACYLNQSGNEKNNENNSSGEGRGGRGREMYYPQYLNGLEGPSSSSGQKDIVAVDDGCGFSGRKEGSYVSESGESLRAILSDPITGALMDNAMILPCGHSFGTGEIQKVVRMKACCTCSGPVSEDLIAPNLTLRVAVQAFRGEEELHVNRSSKRRREKYDREKGTYGDSTPTDHQRGRGVEFPFVVTDRVVIKGNKRTPQRFVGGEAIVTTQCLNGWYVVKTVDTAESVKLQYRSLAKVAENNPSSRPSTIRTSNWL